MSERRRPHHLRTVPVRPSLDDAEGPDFSRLLTQTLRADFARLPHHGRHDLASRVVERLRRDPGMIGERMRCAADRHRRLRQAAGRMTAVVLVVALAVVAGRVEPPSRGVGVVPSVSEALERDLQRQGERWGGAIDALGGLGPAPGRAPDGGSAAAPDATSGGTANPPDATSGSAGAPSGASGGTGRSDEATNSNRRLPRERSRRP